MAKRYGCQEEGERQGWDVDVAEYLLQAEALGRAPWISSSHTTWEPYRNVEFQASDLLIQTLHIDKMLVASMHAIL